MARFYTDHNVSLHTAIALRRRGHDVITSRQLHQERAEDYRQLLIAAGQDRILVTHNEADFSLLHGAWRVWTAAWQVSRRHAGIVCIPQVRRTQQEWSPEGAAERLADFVDSAPALKNQLHVWRQSTGWMLRHV